MADTLINWHRTACTCEGEDRCIHCQTVAALSVKDELVAALGNFAILGHGKCTIGKPAADIARAALTKATAA